MATEKVVFFPFFFNFESKESIHTHLSVKELENYHPTIKIAVNTCSDFDSTPRASLIITCKHAIVQNEFQSL